jgi:hypothetical protein
MLLVFLQMGNAWSIPDKPNKTLGGRVLLGGELVPDQILDGGRLGGSSELAVTQLLLGGTSALKEVKPQGLWTNLDIAVQVTLNRREGNAAEDI